jgi:hypothetical protein
LDEERRRQINGGDIVSGIGGVVIGTGIPTAPPVSPPGYADVFPDRVIPAVPDRDLKPRYITSQDSCVY